MPVASVTVMAALLVVGMASSAPWSEQNGLDPSVATEIEDPMAGAAVAGEKRHVVPLSDTGLPLRPTLTPEPTGAGSPHAPARFGGGNPGAPPGTGPDRRAPGSAVRPLSWPPPEPPLRSRPPSPPLEPGPSRASAPPFAPPSGPPSAAPLPVSRPD